MVSSHKTWKPTLCGVMAIKHILDPVNLRLWNLSQNLLLLQNCAAETHPAFFKANTKYPLHMVLETYLKYEPSSSWCSSVLLSPELVLNNLFERCKHIHLNEILSQSLKKEISVTVFKPFHYCLFKVSIFNLGVNIVRVPIPYLQAVFHLLLDIKSSYHSLPL